MSWRADPVLSVMPSSALRSVREMAAAQNQELFPDYHNPEGVRVVNDGCLLRTQDGHRVVIVSGIILAQYALNDRMAEAHAMISPVEQGWADQNDVGLAFGYAAHTVRRQQQRFDEGGLAALGRKGGFPRGWARLATSRIQRVQQLRVAGNSYREIARLMGSVPKPSANCCVARDGRSPRRYNPNFVRIRQTCPLFVPKPRKLPSPATTLIQVIAVPTALHGCRDARCGLAPTEESKTNQQWRNFVLTPTC